MTYIAGDPWMCCDRCGINYRRSVMRKEWTGLMVCPQDYDPRPVHLDPPNVYPEGMPIPDARPEPEAYEVGTTEVTRESL